jgi:predicted nucleic acid-binding protein
VILTVDSSALSLLINPAAEPPIDPSTGEPVAHARARVLGLIAGMSASDTVVVPTPVLAEVLVRAEEGAPGVLEQLHGQARIRVRPFDERAAVEVPLMTREALAAGDKRSGSDQPWQKVKYDRQIIAVARVAGTTRIYADDSGLVSFARLLGTEVVSTWDLPIPEGTDNLFTMAGLEPDGSRLA